MGQKVVFISHDLITRLLKQGELPRTTVRNGLPEDAELVRIIPDFSVAFAVKPPRIGLFYQSAEWPELKEGEEIPVLMPVFERTSDA